MDAEKGVPVGLAHLQYPILLHDSNNEMSAVNMVNKLPFGRPIFWTPKNAYLWRPNTQARNLTGLNSSLKYNPI
jgi:hypothetical protein